MELTYFHRIKKKKPRDRTYSKEEIDFFQALTCNGVDAWGFRQEDYEEESLDAGQENDVEIRSAPIVLDFREVKEEEKQMLCRAAENSLIPIINFAVESIKIPKTENMKMELGALGNFSVNLGEISVEKVNLPQENIRILALPGKLQVAIVNLSVSLNPLSWSYCKQVKNPKLKDEGTSQPMVDNCCVCPTKIERAYECF